MDLFVLAFLVILIVGIKPTRNNEDYIGRSTTTAIKGVFAIIILFNHGRQYTDTSSVTYWGGQSYDMLFSCFIDIFGQLMVVMFLTYSGYGIMESFKQKKDKYTNSFFRKRVLKTLLHFDIAVTLFFILALVFGHEYTLQEKILCWTGWESIGNSNWFIFDIIVLYLITYVGLIFINKHGWKPQTFLWYMFGACCLFIFFLMKTKPDLVWWYDTVLSFPTGMLWSVYKERIEAHLKNNRNYFASILATALLMAATYWLGHNFKVLFMLPCSGLFAIFVILITMRLKIGNKLLYWLGVNAFAIYILQRIPMIIASECGLHLSPIMFFAVVIPTTMLIASIFTYVMGRMDRIFFK